MTNETPHKIRVMVADSLLFFRKTMRLILADLPDIRIIAEAGDSREMLHKLSETRPDVLILDVNLLPMGDGTDLIEAVHKASPATKTLVLTMGIEACCSPQCPTPGAVCYLTKNITLVDLIAKIREIAAKKVIVSQDHDDTGSHRLDN